MRLLAFGDIHGCLGHLDDLLAGRRVAPAGDAQSRGLRIGQPARLLQVELHGRPGCPGGRFGQQRGLPGAGVR